MIYDEKISSRYPSIKSLKITLVYKHFDTDKLSDPKTITLSPENTLSKFKCPYWECVDGEFDLIQKINAIVDGKKKAEEGEIVCSGWQDRERISKHRCYCKLIYNIEAEYIE